MPKTKIVCTIGPACASGACIRNMIDNGMNVARLNFSHGSHADHLEKIELIRDISEAAGVPVAILQDLCGPKIRVGRIPEPGIMLENDAAFVLTGEQGIAEPGRVSVSYPDLPRQVVAEDRVLLADGLMELVVERTTDAEIHCRVTTGGRLTSHKGINLPSGSLNMPALTEKDKADLEFGLTHHLDMIAMSFVRSADDIREIKEVITAAGQQTPVIAKIEKHEAVDRIDDILAEADGIMVARGDLGVEIPLENVPNIQKTMIQKANRAGKPAIIATQMLRSMVSSPRPTRAEANDVANGVLDGADAIMLSEETATGAYPEAAVAYMARIARSAETHYPHERYMHRVPRDNVSSAVSYAACILAEELDARAIVATTRSGATAKHISQYRPRTKTIALSPDRQAIRRLMLHWGVIPCYLPISDDTDEMIEKAAVAALDTGLVNTGDRVVITAGRPVWAKGTTNMVWVKDL